MNKISKIYTGLIAAMIALAGMCSCTDDFEKTNTDPNKMNVGELKPYGMFENLFYGTARQQCYYSYYWSDELVQFTACTSLTAQERHRYKIVDNDWINLWSNYATKAANAVHMYDLAEKWDDDACRAIALTLKVYLMSNLTDLFGDIPYAEAFRGSEGIDKPRFDTQADVYRQMFSELEEANDIYAQKPEFESPTMDIMYGGDMALWRKFNNSLYLRLLCRVCGRSEMNVGEKMKEIIADAKKYPVFTSNAESATIRNTGVDPYYNRFRPVEIDVNSFSKNAYLVTEQFLKMTIRTDEKSSEIDPRLTTWCIKRSEADGWSGTQAGCTPEESGIVSEGAAYLNYDVLVRDDAHHFLMDYSEVLFILAEAAHKGLIDGGEAAARSYYESAVKASCEKWAQYEVYSKRKAPLTAENIDKFINGKLAGWESNDNKDQLIAEQKFLSLFWVGMEAYHELRRTSYPRLTIGPGTSYNKFQLPQRMAYPTTTTGPNPDGVAEAIARQGANDMITPVWWSYKAINGDFPTANAQ